MVLRLQRTGIGIALLIASGCVSYPRPHPWNFPPAYEWNAPLETSWVNLVDNWRNLTDTNKKFKALDRDLEEHELYQ